MSRRSIVLFFSVAPALLADGGAVLLHQEADPFVITAFASPVPLRAGMVDISVMVQERDTLQPVLDAAVSFRLASGGSEIAAQASHQEAQNKLLYAAAVNLAAPGEWRYSVTIRRHASSAMIFGTIMVEAAQPKLASYWSYFAFPPACILIFAIHQWLGTRRPSELEKML